MTRTQKTMSLVALLAALGLGAARAPVARSGGDPPKELE